MIWAEMSLSRASLGCAFRGLVIAMCVGAWAAPGAETPARSGRAIEFSEPRQSTLVTNVGQLDQQSTAARNFSKFSPDMDSTTASTAPAVGTLPAPSAFGGRVVNKPAKSTLSTLDLLGNSESDTPEDVLRNMLLRKLLKLPSTDKKDREADHELSVQSIYQQMLSGNADAAKGPKHDGLGLSGTQSSPDNFTAVDESRPWWNADNPLGNNYAGPAVAPGSVPLGIDPNGSADLFGFRANTPSTDLSPQAIQAKQAQQVQMKKFQDLLNGVYDSAPAGASSHGAGSLMLNPLTGSAPPADSAAGHLNPFTKTPGIDNSYLSPPKPPANPVPSSLAPVVETPPPPREPAPKPVFSRPEPMF